MKNEETKSNGWKITAIIFIVLFIIETLAFVWFMYVGITGYDKETKCFNKCIADGARSYSQTGDSDLCTCYYNDETTKNYLISQI